MTHTKEDLCEIHHPHEDKIQIAKLHEVDDTTSLHLAEIFKGSPVSDRAFEVGQRIGMAMLAVLMALALFNDVSRLF